MRARIQRTCAQLLSATTLVGRARASARDSNAWVVLVHTSLNCSHSTLKPWLRSDPLRSKSQRLRSPPRNRQIHQRRGQRTPNSQVKPTLQNSSQNTPRPTPFQSLPNHLPSGIRPTQKTEPPPHHPRPNPSPNRSPSTLESMTEDLR